MIDTRENSTNDVLMIARNAAMERGIGKVVVATTRGETARIAVKLFQDSGLEIIVVSHSTGFKVAGEQELLDEVRIELEEGGIRVITGTMPFHGVEDCLRKSKGCYSVTTAMADALRMLGQGTKVCVEIACMAADAGAVGEGEEIIAVAGTRFGADTVLLVRTSSTRRILELRVLEVIAKPTHW